MSQGVPTPIPTRPHRPTLLTANVIAGIERHLSIGGYPTVALEAINISATQHSYWCQRAQEDYDAGLTAMESIYCQYAEAVKRGQAVWEAKKLEQLESVHQKAATDRPELWASITTSLERRAPDRWGRRDESRQGANAPVQIQIINYHGPQPVPLPTVAVRELPPATSE